MSYFLNNNNNNNKNTQLINWKSLWWIGVVPFIRNRGSVNCRWWLKRPIFEGIMDLQCCPLGLINGSHWTVISKDVWWKLGQASLINSSKNEGWCARLCHHSMRIIGTMGMHFVQPKWNLLIQNKMLNALIGHK